MWYYHRVGRTRIIRSTMRCAYREFYRSETTLCERGGHQFKLGQSNKRLTVCTYERRVLIDVREFIGDRSTIKGIQLTTTEFFTLKVLMPRVNDELMRQMKLLRE